MSETPQETLEKYALDKYCRPEIREAIRAVLAENVGSRRAQSDCVKLGQFIGSTLDGMGERDSAADQMARMRLRVDKAEAALREIESLAPSEYVFPADWGEQIKACPECLRYKDHPIQQGICDLHRRPLYARESHDAFEAQAIGPRAQRIARAALRDTTPAEEGKP